ncbi:Hypothetical protein PMT_2763 [Prochlorococcus marinus str. MIT 9313]|uniref:Uncharacterized protein n=1 Tax=Prochlorococcus marinus (strain MIT 9313) TaxID=74547 RepID=B9ESE0_PROMM|nr:Hypothetical protein PMT_2763 [Prochlorococcus marinus str. MIT 9313]
MGRSKPGSIKSATAKTCKLDLCLPDRGLDHCHRQCPRSYLLPIPWRQTSGVLALDALTNTYASD